MLREHLNQSEPRDSLPLKKLLLSRKLPGLDGFRMIAVFSVVFYHGAWGSQFFSARHGVSGFFVLSGFLITWLLMKEYENNNSISFSDFFMRRVLRIFPAYYVFLAVTIILDSYLGDDRSRSMLFPGIFYLINYYNAFEGHPNTSLAHAWSLAVEEQFYLLWPAIFSVLVRRGQKALIIGCLTLIAAVAIWRSLAFSYLDFGSAYVYNAFDTRFDNILVGCLLAVLVRYKLVQGWAEKISAHAFMPIVPIVLLHLSMQATSRDYIYGPAFTIDAVLLAVLLIQLMMLSQKGFWSWLNFRFVVYLGTISYPIYLYHQWGLSIGNRLFFFDSTGRFLAGVVAGVVLAMGSYHIIERPFLKLKHRFSA